MFQAKEANCLQTKENRFRTKKGNYIYFRPTEQTL